MNDKASLCPRPCHTFRLGVQALKIAQDRLLISEVTHAETGIEKGEILE